jgi:site-specific DNA recombinase
MQGQHSHGVAYYRCRFPQEYALANKVDHPRNVIMREDLLIKPLDTWLAQEFGPRQRRHTITKLLDQARAGAPIVTPAAATGPTIAECDTKLARYRDALEAGADPAVVASWIAQVQAERQRAEQRQRTAAQPTSTSSRGLNDEQIIAIVDELGDMVTVLHDAEPEHKYEVYRNLGLRLTYHPETKTVRADVDLAAHRWDSVCVRRGT